MISPEKETRNRINRLCSLKLSGHPGAGRSVLSLNSSQCFYATDSPPLTAYTWADGSHHPLLITICLEYEILGSTHAVTCYSFKM